MRVFSTYSSSSVQVMIVGSFVSLTYAHGDSSKTNLVGLLPINSVDLLYNSSYNYHSQWFVVNNNCFKLGILKNDKHDRLLATQLLSLAYVMVLLFLSFYLLLFELLFANSMSVVRGG